MIEIKDLLLRFEKILVKEEAKKEIIKSVLDPILGTDIKTEDIKIKNGDLFLNIKPIYKNELLLRREEVSRKLEEALGKKAPKEIR